MNFTQPVLRCPMGHIIPDGSMPIPRGRKRPMLACAICAKEVPIPPGVLRLINKRTAGKCTDEQTSMLDADTPSLRIR